MRYFFIPIATSLLALATPAHSTWTQQVASQSPTSEAQTHVTDTRPLSFRQLEWDYGNLSNWQRWWALERDRYASPRVHARRGAETVQAGVVGQLWVTRVEDVKAPTRAQKEYLIRPALLQMYDEATDRDMAAESMLALARIGMFPQQTVQALRPALRAPSLDVAQSAILGMGLVGDELAISELTSILQDDEHGRWLLGEQHSVSGQPRAWAALALASAARNADAQVQATVRRDLMNVATTDGEQADLRASALLAASILRPANADASLDVLIGMLHEQTLSVEVRAHVPSALAHVAVFTGPATQGVVRTELLDLLKPSVESPIRHGALVALGALPAQALEGKDPIIDQLIRAAQSSVSPLERGLACKALARVAGVAANVQDTVRAGNALAELVANSDTESACWAMIASGIMLHERADWQDVNRVRLEREILQQLTRSKNPELRAAAAIGLGLAGQERAIPTLREICGEEGVPSLRGHAAVALGLLQDSEAEELLLAQLQGASHDGTLLERTAVGLAILGSEGSHAALLDMLAPNDGVTPTLAEVTAASRAIGLVGHARTAPYLLSAMDNSRMTVKSRALAARALGQIAERDSLPWQLTFTSGLLHTAAPASLLSWDHQNGVLDRR